MATALQKKASDIHIEQQAGELVVRLRVDGVLREVLRLTDDTRAQLISRIKILADLDIAERRVPQDGRFLSRCGEDCYDIRVSTLPTHFGEKVVMRILNPRTASVRFETLGLSPDASAALAELIRLPQGMILVTGPTGSGKSTTLYAALNLIRSGAINITTIEDPIEYVIEGANQVQVDVKAGRTFASCLRSMLRQDPNVVMVGEIRDAETAEIALTGAQTGHLLFSTLHTNDSTSAISRLVDLQVPPFFIASSVNAILAQRLVRKLCTCRLESPDVTELQAGLLSMGYKKTPIATYIPQGCEKCDNSGFSGRIGVYELLLLDDRVRQAIRNNMRDEVLRDFATSSGMLLMADDAVNKVLQGVTTLEEVQRVVPCTKRVNPLCSNCDGTLHPSYRFCPHCGTPCQPDLDLSKETYGLAHPYGGTQ
jgi:type II secretory ATPase GspE/PulE/Tfp pilus assembly ATPase PilB-like protein